MTEDRNERPLTTADIYQAGKPEVPQTEPRPRTERTAENQSLPLLKRDAEDEFRSRWTTIQAKFVDDPRSAVEEADSLVAELMKRIAEMFANERSGLEAQWTSGDNVTKDTEDLRIALQHYRSFFNRLLSL